MTPSKALGEKMPMFLTGNSLNPHCFKGVKNKPYQYRAQKKAWINLNKKAERQNCRQLPGAFRC